MPRETEGRRSAHHAAAAKTEHDTDFEAEHRPEAARRASTAAIRRGATGLAASGHGEAEHASLPEATPEQQRTQRGDADTASFRGLESAIVLCAKRLLGYANEIHGYIVQPTTEAGIYPFIDAIRQRIRLASDEFRQLNTRIGSVKPEDAAGMPRIHDQLHPALGQLDMASSRVHIAAAAAQQFASRHGEHLDTGENLKDLDRYTADIHNKLLPRDGDTPPPQIELRAVDNRPIADLADEAMKENLTAIIEAARAVRMSLATGKEHEISGEIRRVIRHTGEVATLLTQMDHKALKQFRGRGQQAIAELDGLEKDLAGKPHVREQLHENTFPGSISALRTRFGSQR